MNKKILTPIIIIIALLILGIGAFFVFQKSAFPEPIIGRCGDGVCDEKEQANLNLCPKDCQGEVKPTIPTKQGTAIGFIGCSITHNAVDGYQKLGGKSFWTIERGEGGYGGGSLDAWYMQLLNGAKTNDYWSILQYNLNQNPNTKKIWWELCSSAKTNKLTYENILAVLEKIKKIAPDAEIYATPMPIFLDTTQGICVDNNGPQITKNFTDKMVQEDKVKAGPALSSLRKAQTMADGCHANEQGQATWGQNLMDFFGSSAEINTTNPSEVDVPWSAFYMHVEDSARFESCFDDIISLANKYHTPLTLMLHSRIRDLILNDSAKLAKVKEWQAQGHEFGIHAQGCLGSVYCQDPGSCLKEGDAEKYEELVAPYELKTAHVTPCIFGYGDENECVDLLPSSVLYGGAGRFDGRNAVSIKYNVRGRTFYLFNVRAGYEEESEKELQYNSLNEDEIYFTGSHAECNLAPLENWLKFLSEKDPEGKKRKTQSWLMENVIIPKNRIVSDSEIFNSENETIQKCSQLVGGNVFTDSWSHSPTDIFNFGRCINTETYCYSNEKCNNDGTYSPTICEVRGISNLEGYKPVSEICGAVVCGDNKCSRGEDRSDSPILCLEDCKKR